MDLSPELCVETEVLAHYRMVHDFLMDVFKILRSDTIYSEQ